MSGRTRQALEAWFALESPAEGLNDCCPNFPRPPPCVEPPVHLCSPVWSLPHHSFLFKTSLSRRVKWHHCLHGLVTMSTFVSNTYEHELHRPPFSICQILSRELITVSIISQTAMARQGCRMFLQSRNVTFLILPHREKQPSVWEQDV